MKKTRTIAFLLVLVTILGSFSFASANDIQPFYISLMSVSVGCSADSKGVITCNGGGVGLENSYKLYVTVVLQQYISGIWTTIATWEKNGSSNGQIAAGGTHTVKPLSNYYRTKVTIDVYDSNNRFLEQVSEISWQQYY